MTTMSDDVMNDLLTVYLAGEASADTRALVEAYAREHPAVAERLRAAGAFSLSRASSLAPPPDHQLLTIKMTRKFIMLRQVFVGLGIFFTLLPFSAAGGDGGWHFVFLGRQPGLIWAFWSLAAASWAACYVMQRRVRQAGL